MAAGGLVQEDGQTDRARLTFANPAEEEILRDSAIEDGIDEKNVAALEFAVIFWGGGSAIGEKNFAVGMAVELDVADVFLNKVEIDGKIDGANEISGKDKRAIHGDDNIEPAAMSIMRDLSA